MKKIFCIICTFLFASIASADSLGPSMEGKGLGITENDQVITKIFNDSNGNSEVLAVFKSTQSKISWQLEYRNPKNNISSRIQNFRDGSELIENFSSDGKVVSRVQKDKNGKGTVQNF